MSSSTFNSEPIATTRQSLFATAMAILVVVFASVLASWLEVREPDGVRARVDSIHMEQARPDMVLLGNSMLDAGIDVELLATLLGRRIVSEAEPGSASAFWYLYTKNVLMTVEPPPPVLVIFFRDQFLTLPRFRVDPPYRERLDEYSLGHETELWERALAPGQSPGDRVLRKYWALSELRPLAQRTMRDLMRDGFAGRVVGVDEEGMGDALGHTFDRSFSDLELATTVQLNRERVSEPDSLDFQHANESSFLPLIVRMTKERGVRLFCVRIRRRALNRSSSPDLDSYMNDLRLYLQQNGATLMDFAEDARIREEHFADGDHLNEKGRELFTTLVAERLGPLLSDD